MATFHWVVGGGSVGCLYDYGPQPCETLDEALDALFNVYDLSTEERNQLRWEKHLSFDTTPCSALGPDESADGLSRRQEAGADYCEITVQDGPCPEGDE